MNQSIISGLGFSGVITLMQDEFGGSGAINGRTPDTVNPGDTWHTTGYGDTTGNVSGGYGGSLTNSSQFRIDVGAADYTVTAIVKSTAADAFNDNAVIVRVGDLVDDGLITDGCFVQVEHDTDTIVISERVADVIVSSNSVAYNPPEGVDFELKIVVSGSTITASCGATSVQLTGIADTTSTNLAIFPRSYLTTPKSFFNSIKVDAL